MSFFDKFSITLGKEEKSKNRPLRSLFSRLGIGAAAKDSAEKRSDLQDNENSSAETTAVKTTENVCNTSKEETKAAPILNAESSDGFHYSSDSPQNKSSEEKGKEDIVSEAGMSAEEKGMELAPHKGNYTVPIFAEATNLDEVYGQLKTSEIKGKQVVVKDICNIQTILETDDRIAGKIAYNEFTGLTVVGGNVPWNAERSRFREITDTDMAALHAILQRDYDIRNRSDLEEAVMLVTNRHRFNPLIDLLESFQWDGKEGHIRKLLPYYLGAEDSDYNYEVMKLTMVAAVKRVYEAGAKFDFVLTLVGGQGIGKSSFVRMLALNDEYFSDSLVNLDGDEAAQSLLGIWIVELAELKAIQQTKGGDEAVKRFISATQDRLRLPYERRFRTYPRQFILVGTVNSHDFLEDITGNRRYLIVECDVNKPHTKELFLESARADIEAAWAEAVHIYKTENPKLDDLPPDFREEAETMRMNHTADDGRKGLIFEFLKDRDVTCSLEIWDEVLNEKRPMTHKDSRIITDIVLSDPEWEHTNAEKYGEYGNQRLFKRKPKQ